MKLLDSIKSRRSIAKVIDTSISNDLIEQIIEAGCYAPAHHRTDPWRFTVFKDGGRKKLQSAIDKHIANNEKNDIERDRKLLKMQNKSFRAPVIIAVWCATQRMKKNPPVWEDESAVSACLQNMSLASHALSLGSIWRTGNIVDMQEVQELCTTKEDSFDITKGDKIMGFLYIGTPDISKTTPTRCIDDWQNKIKWVTD